MDTLVRATAKTPGRRVIFFLMVTAFLNTIGIGIVQPVLAFLIQPYVGSEGALALTIGWLVSSYAICQFIAAPILGGLSDRYGRRPILLICMAGSAFGYLLFGLGGALWIFFLGRIIDGLTGGNFSILSAYVADITAPSERGKYFGMFGAVAGAGFMIGPAIGGLAAKISPQAPAFLAAGITLLSLIWGYFNLAESLPAASRSRAKIALDDLNIIKQLSGAFALARLRWLLIAAFLIALPFAVLQSNASVLIIQTLDWQADRIGMMFLFIGGADILMQGILMPRLLPIFGDAALAVAGLICQVAAYALIGSIALVASPTLLLIGIGFYAVGSGLLEPAQRGMISQAAGPGEQGVVQGAAQSIQSLALVLGPLLGGALYTRAGHAAPYWSSAVLVALAAVATLLAIPALRASRNQAPGAEAA